MAGLIIIISSLFLGFIVFTLTKVKVWKYILSVLSIALFGFLLLYVGMGFGNVFFIIAALPIIIGIILVFRKK